MDAPQASEWRLAERVAFRFVFAYVALYFFPLPSGLASPDWLSGVFDRPWQALVTWVCAHVLHIKLTIAPSGSGDTTYDWVRVACMLVLALLAATVWSLADRRRKEYRILLDWGRVWLRYALGMAGLTYGIVKVIKLQFPAPSYGRLSETYGESSPMGLLWTFMGFSTGYTFFAGAGEMLGGLLLFFRRTATLGALVLVGVMSNVVVLNFCYDVPVKLGSSHLLAAAILIAAPDLRRLANVLVLNRRAEPADLRPHVERRWLRLSGVALKVLVIGAALSTQTWDALEARKSWGGESVPPDGSYAVSSFVEDGVDVPPLATDPHRWKTFVLRQGYVRLWGQDRSSRLFKADGDPTRGSISLVSTSDDGTAVAGAVPAGTLAIAFESDGAAKLDGTLDGHHLVVAMARQDVGQFPLMRRGFHWISEQPYNK